MKALLYFNLPQEQQEFQLRHPSQDETRRANVLREEMLSQFRMFGESLSIIREEVTGIKPRLDRVEEKVTVLESAVRTNGRDINALKDAVHRNTEAIHAVQADVVILKSDVAILKLDVSILKSDVSEIKGDIKVYNQRLSAIEA